MADNAIIANCGEGNLLDAKTANALGDVRDNRDDSTLPSAEIRDRRGIRPR